MSKDGRYRTWAFVVYPESAPASWRETLGDIHAPWYESPLHDQDVNPTGEKKKAHWHCIMQFAGKQSFDRIKDITDSINAARPEPVKELKGYLRYFAHLDNPEKAQYDVKDIKAHCGADLAVLTAPTASERHKFINEMREYVKANDIVEFSDLLDYSAEYRNMDWFPLLCDNSAFVMEKYIASRRHRNKGSYGLNDQTGEFKEK